MRPGASGWRATGDNEDEINHRARGGAGRAEGIVFKPGLEGVVAFETEIAEPDKEGSALRYRGVDIEELAGNGPFEQVSGLILNERPERGLRLPGAAVEPVSRTGDARIDLQATLPTLASQFGLRQLMDVDADQARKDLAIISAATLSIVAQALRGDEPPVPKTEVEQ